MHRGEEGINAPPSGDFTSGGGAFFYNVIFENKFKTSPVKIP